MARPKSKAELLIASQTNFDKLNRLVDAMPPDEQHRAFPEGTMNRNVRDVLAHLHHWHLMLLGWYAVGMTGQKPDMPAPGYTWKTTPQLNQWIWEHYSDVALDDIKARLRDSFSQVQAIIHHHTDDELFEKKRYSWTGSTSLGAYLISATSSHYDWALKLIKKANKPTRS